MNGPEHYAEAELCIESANYARSEEGDRENAAYLLEQARVHAMLAQVAAIAELEGVAYGDNVGLILSRPEHRADQWSEVMHT